MDISKSVGHAGKLKAWTEKVKHEIADNLVIACNQDGSFTASLSTELPCLAGTSLGVDTNTKRIVLKGNLDDYITNVVENTQNKVDDRIWNSYKSQILSLFAFVSQARGKLGAAAVWGLIKGLLPK